MKFANCLCSRAIALVLVCVTLGWISTAYSQMRIRRGGGVAGPGSVGLPYQQSDNTGNMWMIFDGGWMRQNGGQMVYAQAAMLTVNGQGISSNSNQAQVDPKTGELIMDNMTIGPVTVTRRILIDKEDGYIRYVDIFKNTQAQDQTVNAMIQTNLNYGVNSAANVNDPKHKDHQIGWVAMTGINRAAVEMYAGKGAKNVPNITYQQGSNMVQATMALTIPAGKSVAFMHFHATTNTQDQGQAFINDLKESKVIQTLPPEIRHILVNFSGGQNYIGDMEILRGDVFDVVELRTGDQMKGTLKEDSYKLTTFYGNVELPRDQVIAMINVGQFRPRQLVVTTDGQIFGGQLNKDSISLELSSGQVTQIPVSQITRLGYKKRPGEPDEWTFDKPTILMRAGDRVSVDMPTTPIDVTTRYGLLKLDPQTIAAIAFQSEDNAVHEIYLTDGSKFAGLVMPAEFDMKLTTGVSAQNVKFPASSIFKMQLAGKAADLDDDTPTLTLANDDILVGTLSGQMKLDTTFDTLTLNAPEIRRISHATQGSADVQVTLWDNTTVSGQLEDPTVQCALVSGATMTVPLALVSEYNQPMPQPSATMVEKIKTTVANLNADDWKQRDQAEGDLVKMGPSVMGVLKQLRAAQPPEAQQRIDSILKQLAKIAPARAAADTSVATPVATPVMLQPQD